MGRVRITGVVGSRKEGWAGLHPWIPQVCEHTSGPPALWWGVGFEGSSVCTEEERVGALLLEAVANAFLLSAETCPLSPRAECRHHYHVTALAS